MRHRFVSLVPRRQPAELAVDTANLQYFDPDSGLSIRHPQASAEPA